MICDELVSKVELLDLPNSLVVTGKIPIPTEIWNGLQILRLDLKTMHEEADLSFLTKKYIRQALDVAVSKLSVMTHVFVLLAHYYAEKKLTSTLPMEPTKSRSLSS